MKSEKLTAIEFSESDDIMKHDGAVREHHAASIARELQSDKTKQIFKSYLPGENVIDFGSANGVIFSVFTELGLRNTHGADIGDYLTVARPSGSMQTFDFVKETFPYADDTFDGATSIEVIEHLENPYHFLREVARVLKPGAPFILSTPNPDHVWNKMSFFRHGDFYRFLEGNNHIMLFSNHILQKGALKYFDLIATEYLFGELPYRALNRFTYPESKYFGRTVFYILKKKLRV